MCVTVRARVCARVCARARVCVCVCVCVCVACEDPVMIGLRAFKREFGSKYGYTRYNWGWSLRARLLLSVLLLAGPLCTAMSGKAKLSFPPLVKKWTVKGEPNWPGAEYTRRTRLKTTTEVDFSSEFVDELKELLGEEHFNHFEAAMKPTINRRLTRGKPANESGPKPIRPPYVLPRAQSEEQDLQASMASTSMSLSGTTSRTKFADTIQSPWGFVPEYMFEDREKLGSLDEWFEKYGRCACARPRREARMSRVRSRISERATSCSAAGPRI